MDEDTLHDSTGEGEFEPLGDERPPSPPPPRPSSPPDDLAGSAASSLVARIKARQTGPAALGKKPLRHSVAFALTVLLVPTLIALGTWSSYWARQRNDQYQLLVLGQTVYHGGRMYVDAWENKPPGVAWLNAAGYALGRGRALVAWILPGVAALVGVLIFASAMARLLTPLAARRAALLAAIVFSLRLYDSPSAHPDFYSAIVELVAASFWLLALYALSDKGRVGYGLFAGLALALACTFRHTGSIGLLAVSVGTLLMLFGSSVDRRAWVMVSMSVWSGVLVGVGAVIGALYWAGSVEPAWEAIVAFNRGLLAEQHVSEALGSWRRSVDGLLPLRLPIWLGMVGVVATLFARETQRASRGPAGVLLLWWLLQVAVALLGPSQSMRYWQASWGPMLCLAAIGLFQLELAYLKLPVGYRAGYVLACATVLVMLFRPLAQSYRHGVADSYLAYAAYREQSGGSGDGSVVGDSAKRSERMRYEEIGRAVRELVPDGERIYVMAYDAGVYVHADRLPASRFTYPRSRAQMDEILSDLESGKAYALLVPDRPAPAFESWCDGACHERVAVIRAGYSTFTQIDGYRVWHRGPSSEATH